MDTQVSMETWLLIHTGFTFRKSFKLGAGLRLNR